MIGTKLVLNIFGAGILLASAIGIVSLIVIAVNLNTVGNNVDVISADAVDGINRGADSLNAAAGALALAAGSMSALDSGLGSGSDALGDVRLAIANSQDVSDQIQASFSSVGADLLLAAQVFDALPLMSDAAAALESAGNSTTNVAGLFAEYRPILAQADGNVVDIQEALNESRGSLPGIRKEIQNASTNLVKTSDALERAGAAVDDLSSSEAIPTIAMFSLVFLGTINLLLALGGLTALAAARRVG